MDKLFDGLIIIIVVLTSSCGFLFILAMDQQNQYTASKTQNRQYQNQIGQIQTQISELKGQIVEREKEIEDLERQIFQKRFPDARQVKIIKVDVEAIKGNVWGTPVITLHVHVTFQNNASNDVDGLTLYLFFGQHSVNVSVACIEAGGTYTSYIEWSAAYTSETTYSVVLKYGPNVIDQKNFNP